MEQILFLIQNNPTTPFVQNRTAGAVGLSLGLVLWEGLSSLFSLLPPTNHLGAGDITVFVDEVQVSLLFLDAHLGHLMSLAASFIPAGHKGARDIALLVDEIQIPFLLFDANLSHFFRCHSFTSLLFCFYVPTLIPPKNCLRVWIADKTAK